MAAKTAARDTTAEIAFLTRALKAPTLRESVPRLAERARAESWTHEEFLAACLQREVAARESHGGEGRIRPSLSAGQRMARPREHSIMLGRAQYRHRLHVPLIGNQRYQNLLNARRDTCAA
jgi:hypothetical protein